ncbi:MAG: hypothetical protein U1A72_15960 [Sulfuritalea sp.]|nr:hypothetical protein [Sulfuritalea sp.]
MNNFEFADSPTPKPDPSWGKLSDDERRRRVERAVAASSPPVPDIVAIVEARSDGQVIVSLRAPVAADKRGTLLLDFESSLKESVDPGLVVWLEPLGDRSSLRNLRGIEVKF